MTPVKATRLHRVDAVELGELGAVGNRRFFLVDERDRMVNSKMIGELQTVVASVDGEQLRFSFPDGRTVESTIELGEPPTEVRFFSASTQARPLLGPLSDALSDHVGRRLRVMEGVPAVDRGRQGGASLISQASLGRLAEVAGEDVVDPRRFRMLIEVGGVAPHEEDGWVGRTVRIGDAAVRFHGHVGRCLITSRDPDTGAVDLPTLDVLGEYRREVDVDGAAAVRHLRRGRPVGHGPARRSGRRRLTPGGVRVGRRMCLSSRQGWMYNNLEVQGHVPIQARTLGRGAHRAGCLRVCVGGGRVR